MALTKRQKWCGGVFALLSCLVMLLLYTYVGPSTTLQKLTRNDTDSLTKEKTDITRKEGDDKLSDRNSGAGIHGMLRKTCMDKLHENRHHAVKQSSMIIVNDKYKVMYCYIPKIACTNLKILFILLTERLNTTDPLSITSHDAHFTYRKLLRFLKHFSRDEVMYRLDHYKKVIFVREPFERLLSAYRNKFVQKGNEVFKKGIGRSIIKQFRRNATKESLAKGHDVTFTEFVQYLLRQHSLKKGFNAHWATYTDICKPCSVNYNFIGRFERLDDDMNILLADIGVSSFIRFPKREETYGSVKTKDIMYEFYKDIQLKDLMKLKDIYANDFLLFDYKIPAVLSNMMGNKTIR